MNKEEILREIKRTADANGGVPLGMDRFHDQTGICESDWKGKYWARWGDALREAGLSPNRFGIEAYKESHLLNKYAQYARELGRLPTTHDLRLKRRQDSTFPSAGTFAGRWKKSGLVNRLVEYCQRHDGYDDVLQLCAERELRGSDVPLEPGSPEEHIGFVYLMKSGRYYKIGKSDAPGRREYELTIQLPEPVKRIHVIRTDDPGGIEAYWHKRFDAKRRNGEWFELDATDVAAFKRRKFM